MRGGDTLCVQEYRNLKTNVFNRRKQNTHTSAQSTINNSSSSNNVNEKSGPNSGWVICCLVHAVLPLTNVHRCRNTLIRDAYFQQREME